MLTVAGRRWRALVTVLVVAAMVAGAGWGDDDDFPFAPFKMYSTAPRHDGGVVGTPRLLGVTTDGAEVEITPGVVGLRPAELEGQYPRFREDPGLLEVLAEAYERAEPGEELVEVRLERRRRVLEGGRVVEDSTTTVAEWRAEP